MKFRHVIVVFCASLTFSLVVVDGRALAYDLQNEIDRAEKGEVIHVPSGEYEGPIVIDKPIVLMGDEGAVIHNTTDTEALLINSSDVQVDGVTIVHETSDLSSRAVVVNGHNNLLSNMTIKTQGMGIVLDKANENTIRHVVIEGALKNRQSIGSMLLRQGNGIDLFQSHSNLIEKVTIRNVQDGIYIERSDRNVVNGNDVRDSRYGIHLMFTEKTTLSSNTAVGNITGAMVMGSKATLIENNCFSKQADHVYSQGLMLYDVQDATITANMIEQNLVGILVDSSSNNRIFDNNVHANYIGLEIQHAQTNELRNNNFTANVISARAKDSSNNTVLNNYWDEFLGFDADGDHISDIPYHADWILSSIIAKKPIYQLFAGSPGLMFLHHVIDVNREEAFTDRAPLMTRNILVESTSKGKTKGEIVYYGLSLFICSLIVYGGRKK